MPPGAWGKLSFRVTASMAQPMIMICCKISTNTGGTVLLA